MDALKAFLQTARDDTYSPMATVPLIGFDPDLPLGPLTFEHVLFLDIDGVLHEEGCNQENRMQYIPNFCDAMRSAGASESMPIVISSMWRFDSKIQDIRAHFPADIGRLIVGVTSDLSDYSSECHSGWEMQGARTRTGVREREVVAWMHKYAPAGDWLAIDDRASLFTVDCEKLFLVPGRFKNDGDGLTEEVSAALKERIGAFLCNPQRMLSQPSNHR